MKPYQYLPIQDCGEPLVAIPPDTLARVQPHAYQKLGAPYGNASPFCVRRSILVSLLDAQSYLQQRYPNWQILIFDAYRPVAVQQFMVDYTLAETARAQNLHLETLTLAQRQALLEQVYQIWAIPSHDPLRPPPHSTGAVVDVTLIDARGEEVFMGSPIDELSERSQPDYFAQIAANPKLESSERKMAARAAFHRQLLHEIMTKTGFQRHPGEWWHFCLGDQMWAWLTQQQNPRQPVTARYGRIEPDEVSDG